MMLSRRYFQEAVKLDPSDARYLGFLAGNTLAEGNLHKDEKLTREGYFMLLGSIKAWPEFNLFTDGYIMSRLPADSPRFREGLEWQWRTLDECIEGKIDRVNPDYSKYMAKETKDNLVLPTRVLLRELRVCINLLRGLPVARFDQHVPDVEKEALEVMRSDPGVPTGAANETPKARIMINSEFSCTGCHQN